LEDSKDLPNFEEQFTKVRELLNIKALSKSIKVNVDNAVLKSDFKTLSKDRIELLQNMQELYTKEPQRFNILHTKFEDIVPEMSAIYQKFIEIFNSLNTALKSPKSQRTEELTKLQNENIFPFYKVQNLNKVILAGKQQSEKRVQLEKRVNELTVVLQGKTVNINSFDYDGSQNKVTELDDKIPLNVLDFDTTFEMITFPLTKDIKKVVYKTPDFIKIKAFCIPDDLIPLAQTLCDCVEISIIRAVLNIQVFVEEIKENPTQELWDKANTYFYEKSADIKWSNVKKWLIEKGYLVKNALQSVKIQVGPQIAVKETPTLRTGRLARENLNELEEKDQVQFGFSHLKSRDEARLKDAQDQVLKLQEPENKVLTINSSLRNKLQEVGNRGVNPELEQDQTSKNEANSDENAVQNFTNIALRPFKRGGKPVETEKDETPGDLGDLKTRLRPTQTLLKKEEDKQLPQENQGRTLKKRNEAPPTPAKTSDEIFAATLEAQRLARTQKAEQRRVAEESEKQKAEQTAAPAKKPRKPLPKTPDQLL
jgi:septum formation inhibitor MinC